ncbi:hypothetical protein Y1Q_0024593 [Alligator mississippiensis]|uniref:Uncharacterized protein n=1 Tax=Alligator mississippiensis TaxID=8496 RepID=A0A151NB58_ALLMI|nr:hypothetical protein Y1Q_0024593 [Alligator mississippiensis]
MRSDHLINRRNLKDFQRSAKSSGEETLQAHHSFAPSKLLASVASCGNEFNGQSLLLKRGNYIKKFISSLSLSNAKWRQPAVRNLTTLLKKQGSTFVISGLNHKQSLSDTGAIM